MKTVDKIKNRMIYPLEELASPKDLDIVPTDMRQAIFLRVNGKSSSDAFYPPQAFGFSPFLAQFCQNLHTETNSQKGLSLAYDCLFQGRDKAQFFQIFHALIESADAGQDDMRGFGQIFRIGR